MSGNAKPRSRPLRNEEVWERVQRAGPLDHGRILEAEALLLRGKDVADNDIVATCTPQPRCMPCVEDLTLRKSDEALPGFRHTLRVRLRCATLMRHAAKPCP